MVPKAKALLLHRRRYEVQDRRWKESRKANQRTNQPRKKIRQKIVEMIQRILLVSRILDLFQVIHLKMESISKFVNSHGTRLLYFPRYKMAVYCQDICYGVLRCLYVKSDINYEILVLKKWFVVSKCHFRSIFGSFPVKFPPKNFIWKPKDSSLNFMGGLLSYFWAIVLISAVISILDDFGSLLPARTVTVNPARNFHGHYKTYVHDRLYLIDHWYSRF